VTLTRGLAPAALAGMTPFLLARVRRWMIRTLYAGGPACQAAGIVIAKERSDRSNLAAGDCFAACGGLTMTTTSTLKHALG